MRLIDADELKIQFSDMFNKGYEEWINGILDKAPTFKAMNVVTIPPELVSQLSKIVVDSFNKIPWNEAIEAYKSRPHGYWIKNEYPEGGINFTCTACDNLYPDDPDFCPNCGADMRGKYDG